MLESFIQIFDVVGSFFSKKLIIPKVIDHCLPSLSTVSNISPSSTCIINFDLNFFFWGLPKCFSSHYII